jgi:hypothetical protein
MKHLLRYEELASGDVRIVDDEFDKFDERHLVISRDSLDAIGVNQVRRIANLIGIYSEQ